MADAAARQCRQPVPAHHRRCRATALSLAPPRRTASRGPPLARTVGRRRFEVHSGARFPRSRAARRTRTPGTRFVVAAEMPLRSPPITPAMAIGPFASVINNVSVSSAASRPSSNNSVSPLRARRTTTASFNTARSNACMGWPSLDHHIVGDIHHRIDRTQPGAAQTLLHPRGRLRARIHTANDATEITRAAGAVFETNRKRVRDGCSYRRTVHLSHAHLEQHAGFPRNASQAQTIAAVGRQLDVYADVIELQRIAQRRRRGDSRRAVP